jgi:hypothetical protein
MATILTGLFRQAKPGHLVGVVAAVVLLFGCAPEGATQGSPPMAAVSQALSTVPGYSVPCDGWRGTTTQLMLIDALAMCIRGNPLHTEISFGWGSPSEQRRRPDPAADLLGA